MTRRNSLPSPEMSYLTERDFCARFHIGSRTAQRWRVTGDGPPWVRIGPRRIAYRLADCEAWAARKTFAHRAEEAAGSITQ